MSENDSAKSNMIKFDLYIKASAIDKETKGSCPICQQFFMMTCILGENQDDIDFKVFTVQADCPPKNFASGWSKKYPVVMVNEGKSKTGQDLSGMMYDTFEELELFFESINRECPELKRKNAPNIAAMHVVDNIYKHFNHYISGQSEKGLLGELKKLNEYLESQGTKFLVDNVLSFADCHLLPRLQHIRVAGKAYRNFEIPKEFTYVWRYLKNAYEQEAFRSTMSSDQDIVFHYEKKACGDKHSVKPTLEKFTYTMTVPDDVLNSLDNGADAQHEDLHEEEPAAKSYQDLEQTPEAHVEPDFETAGPLSYHLDEEVAETQSQSLEKPECMEES
ncbi:hypothetical protein BsWGS_12975 [Bradybaena similaris]